MKIILLIFLVSLQALSQVSVGHSRKLNATCNYTNGDVLPCNTVDAHGNVAVWNSATPGIFSIDNTGNGTGITQGTSNVTASVGTTVSNIISQQVVTLKALTLPSVVTIPVGQSSQLPINCNYSNGVVLNCNTVDAYGDSVSYLMLKAGTANIATIGPTGVVTGVTAGSAAIWAETNSLYGLSFIVVQ